MKSLNAKLLQPVLDALPDGVYITDAEGITITVNKAYEKITGLQRHRVLGKHMKDLVAEGYISKSISLEVIREKQPITRVQTIKGDRKIVVSGNPMFDANGELEFVMSSVRDVTALLRAKHAEEQLEQILTVRKNYGIDVDVLTDKAGVLTGTNTRQCYKLAEKVAPTDVKILIQGETGTGKTLLAQFIHDNSLRAEAPFISLNCAAMPEGLIEAELFGYTSGAFTGASVKGKEGLLDIANGGTLFLDEIGDLPLSLQAKLLKVIEENRFLPLGGTRFKTTNIRLITATHHDLKAAIADGKFREDLYYRLQVMPLELPPLRNRQDEILSLLEHYLEHYAKRYNTEKTLHPETSEVLLHYKWPGNIRELMNLAERLVLITDHTEILPKDLPESIKPLAVQSDPFSSASLKEQVSNLERELIDNALRLYGSTRAAAASLGINQSTLVKKRQSLNAVQKQEQ
ncbi:sigma 54-interacting transcriptional regulator [Aliiglaciecola sp. 3_MG-2023]|uniref:sigma-54 interaction domain-containing protein n=1 Tax=Aliiglaciecola sp. 3_MG-2023 TaxID=3062644 RepID=UPI0026E12723|nr:sigma 54-interacting transcriptional regulator [Aliiglaciecola sp. 3_MG-2023]MDO6694811.1 sigma 54-interacting transcriptional regulator [Aliiglaciecola sp. 3_MG-2023]